MCVCERERESKPIQCRFRFLNVKLCGYLEFCVETNPSLLSIDLGGRIYAAGVEYSNGIVRIIAHIAKARSSI